MVPSRPSPRKWSSGSPLIRSERNRTKPLEFPRAFLLYRGVRALLDKLARIAYNKNAKEIAFMEFMKANKKPFGIAKYRRASCCVGSVLAVHKELFVKPLADIVRYNTCCDGQCERNYRIHRVHLLPSGGAGGNGNYRIPQIPTVDKKPHDIAISWGFVHPILQCKDHSTINVQVAAGRTSSPAGAAAGVISGSASPSPRTSALPLQSMVWERRVSAESW